MKIIGTGAEGYICTLHHTELEKFLNLYYGNLKRLDVGATVDLGKGYDFASEAAEAMRKTKEFIESNQKVVSAILNGLQYANLQRSSETQPTESAK